MICPKCGLQAVAEQKFCRSCGENLQMITQRLPKPATVSRREETDRTNSLLSWGFIIMFLGAAIGVVGKKLMHEEVVTVIGVLLALAGMFLSVYPYVLAPRRSRHGDSPSSESELQKSLPHERMTDYVPGVTERTTDLLADSVVTRKRTQTSPD